MEVALCFHFHKADIFGLDAIQDTFDRAFNEWKDDYKMLTELVRTLDNKTSEWWEETGVLKAFDYSKNTFVSFQDYSKLYSDLWEKANSYAVKHLKGQELSYFLKVTY